MSNFSSVSIPILSQDFRTSLLAEAKKVSLRSCRESIGTGPNVVYQRMLLQDNINPSGLFGLLVKEFQLLFNEAIQGLNLFTDEVVFNDWILQKYELGEVGITPHRDRIDYRHVVCLFVLAGKGRYCVSEDRLRLNEQEIANLPGDVVMMPAPGYIGLQQRPFHYLEKITEERYVFGLRHDETKL